jgi:hypothetical protein
MKKLTLVVIATAVVGFVAGMWAEGTIAGHHSETTVAPPTISPFEMQQSVKPKDLPPQYMQGDYN